MAYTEARNRATQKYVKANYERIALTCKKGKKEQYKKQAERAGKSLNSYIIDLLEADAEKTEMTALRGQETVLL